MTEVPEPQPAQKYSGKFLVRVPKSLHRELTETAEKEGVSLNMYVSTALARAVGRAVKKDAGAGQERKVGL